MSAELTGFFKVYRKFFASEFWTEERAFSRAEAWLDLLNIACYMPSSRLIRGKSIRLDVGEVVASERFLAERWKWGRQKVRTFLELLEKNQQITRRITQGEPVINIVKYRVYNGSIAENNPATVPPNNPATTQRQPKYKEGKEGKNKKGADGPPAFDFFSILPEEFRESAEFRKEWEIWLAYRRERKLAKWTPTTLKAKAKEFEAWGLGVTITNIRYSYSSGWQGIFPARQEPDNAGTPDLDALKAAYEWRHRLYDPMANWGEEDAKILKSADVEEFRRRVGDGEMAVFESELAKPFSKMAQFVKARKEK